MAVLRGKMVDAIRQTCARGAWVLPAPRRPQPCVHRLHRLGHPTQTTWHVRLMERSRHGAGVVTYLARSWRGGPLKNARLVAWDGDGVPFTSRAHAAESASGAALGPRMTVPVADVLPRWRLQVPRPHPRAVRSYGLDQHAHPEALARGRAALGPAPVERPTDLDWQTVCAQRGAAPPEPCATWGQLLVCTGVIPRGGAPPPVRARERAA
jgi:hypothetical protein